MLSKQNILSLFYPPLQHSLAKETLLPPAPSLSPQKLQSASTDTIARAPNGDRKTLRMKAKGVCLVNDRTGMSIITQQVPDYATVSQMPNGQPSGTLRTVVRHRPNHSPVPDGQVESLPQTRRCETARPRSIRAESPRVQGNRYHHAKGKNENRE